VLKKANIHYIECLSDKKNTILFIHGLGSSHKQWLLQYHYFKKYFNVIAIDLPGYGASLNTEISNFNDYGEIIKSFCENKGLKDIIFIGHSMGAFILLEESLINYAHNKLSILICPGISLSGETKNVLSIMQKHDYEPFVQHLYTDQQSVYYRQTLEGLKQIKSDALYRDINIFLNYKFHYNPSNKFKYFIGGNNDKILNPSECLTLHNYYEYSEYKLVSGGHMLFLESYKYISQLIYEIIIEKLG
jgi:surfactin synthase thioesterase subunit